MLNCKIEAPYPEPEEGEKRVIFALDSPSSRQKEILGYRLQLIPGRTVTMTKGEAINVRAFDGKIEERTVEGWGYDYYKVRLSNNAISTNMMYTGDDGDMQVTKFVPISRPQLVRYNSYAPVVVYIPEDAELRYSVWTSGDDEYASPE